MMTPPEFLPALIRKTGHFVLATHVSPDGDALGSLLGLADILESMGKRVFCYAEQEATPFYRFLPGSDRLHTGRDDLDNFVRPAGDDVLGISLDCGDRQRLGQNGPNLLKIRPFVVIDHHKGNNGFGDFSWIDSQRSSTGEMIFDLATALGQTVSKEAAICLYAAIVTDTGSFKYELTRPHTFDVARQLVELGVRPEFVAGNLYDNFTFGRLQLMQMVLATLEVVDDGRIAIIRVTRKMLDQTGCTLVDTENLINLPRSVAVVQVAVFLKETGEDIVSVSLRAKDSCDVAEVAREFGGGGHRKAAGFRQSLTTMDEVRNRLLPVLQRKLSR